jgi:hypothetical protein
MLQQALNFTQMMVVTTTLLVFATSGIGSPLKIQPQGGGNSAGEDRVRST